MFHGKRTFIVEINENYIPNKKFLEEKVVISMVWRLPNFLQAEDLKARGIISCVRSGKLGVTGHKVILAKQYEKTLNGKSKKVSTEQSAL